jgi:nitrogen-specific signal transduction histidine kinase/ActR/RegA family two-component response regulator
LERVARVLLELGRARAAPPHEARSGRLEALGRLTGGIVHDFNNLLFVITGQVELARRQLDPEHPAFSRLAPALQAAERAAALTRQLLAFGRGADRRPRLVDVNAVVAQLDGMLQRVIGEDVAIEVRAGRGLGRVKADFAETEQLLLNLALNARDAMPHGGRLVIETKDVEIAGGLAPPAPAGRYAMVAVSDDGVGMDEETRRRMFEPYFTTKPEGTGSGLGLATVHRIIERHGGTIEVDSAPGRGTTFRLYLPCVEPPVEPARSPAAPSALPGGRETVLVAEDSNAVREVTRELLEALGYTVMTAARGEEALQVARDHPGPIDLLLTDVVMPGIRGERLAEQLRAARPRVRTLFMSGYGNGPAPGETGERGPVLRKPFDQGRLARAVRDVLDQEWGQPARA